jgi:hypothetical protein
VSRSNVLFLIIGALIIVGAVMGYELYQDRKQPEGMRIDGRPQRPQDRKEIAGHLLSAVLDLMGVLVSTAPSSVSFAFRRLFPFPRQRPYRFTHENEYRARPARDSQSP